MRGKRWMLAVLLTGAVAVAAGRFYFSPREPRLNDFRDALKSTDDYGFAEDLGEGRRLILSGSAPAVEAPAIPEAITGPAESGSEGLIPIVIYHTADIRLYPSSSTADHSAGLSALAAMLGNESRPHLWIDSGGWFRKVSEGGMRQYEAIFAMFNSLKPAAVVLGNRDLDRLDDNIGRLVREAQFPVLAEGGFREATAGSGNNIRPYSMAEPYPGVKIGIFGVPSGTAGSDMPYNIKGRGSKKEDAEAGSAVQRLRAEGASIIVAAAHADVEERGGRGKGGENGNPVLIEKIPGADLLLGGNAITGGVEQFVIFVDPRTGRIGKTEARVFPLENSGRPPDPKIAKAAGAGKTAADPGSAAYGMAPKPLGRTDLTVMRRQPDAASAAEAGIKREAARNQAGAYDSLQAVIESRLKQPGIKQSILGALTYLDDTQIRNRPGRNSSQYDFSGGDGSRLMVRLNLPARKKPVFVPVPGIRAKNTEGEWASYIRMGAMLPPKFNDVKTLPPRIQDSNMFTTAFVAYPLFLVDDRALPPEQRSVSRMRQMAMENVNQYKRGDGYNFWRLRDGKNSEEAAVAPPNLSTKGLSFMASLLQHKPWKNLLAWASNRVEPTIREWMGVVSNPKTNPTGSRAYFNIPNDADDTAVAVANQALYAAEYDPQSPDPYYRDPDNFRVDLDALKRLEQHRDIDRKKSSAHDAWKGGNSGAFMTWLKDENLPTFGSPESGVLPGAVNLVDEVVNANAVFSMGVNGLTDTDGFRSACRLIATAAETKHWQKAYLYYPQRMIFPYTASRAFRDGGADNEIMRGAMKKLLGDVLADQADFEKRNPRKKGAFPGGADPSTDLSTALGVTFLLNVGRDMAAERGLAEKYDRALAAGIGYLVKNQRAHSAVYKDTLVPEAGSRNPRGVKWKEGLFFAGDPQNLTQWVSEAFTTSMVLEAMNKYALAYDQSGRSIRDTGRLKLSGQQAGGRLDVQWSPK